MLTSEELFPPEYCFTGSCSSHLARPTRSPFSSPHLYPSMSSVSFPTFPPVPPALLPAPFTQRHCFNETGNVQFVRPAPGPWRESRTRSLHSAVHSRTKLFSRFFCRARKIRPTCSLRRALMRVHLRCIAAVSRRAECHLGAKYFFLFFLFFLKTRTRHAVALVMSLSTRRPRNCE